MLFYFVIYLKIYYLKLKLLKLLTLPIQVNKFKINIKGGVIYDGDSKLKRIIKFQLLLIELEIIEYLEKRDLYFYKIYKKFV